MELFPTVERKMRKIRVLEMIDQPFLGGGQKNLLSLARSLDKDQFEVAVCSRDNGPLVDELRKDGSEHFPIPFSKKIKLEIITEIAEIQKIKRFDIIHTHGGVSGFYGRWAAHRCRVPVVIHTLHGIHYLHYRNPILKYCFVLLERYFSRFTDALIFVSNPDKRKGKKYSLAPEKKMCVIENGIEFSGFPLNENRIQNEHDSETASARPIIGTVARLHRQKGLSYLIKAAKKLSQVYPNVKVMIAGEGPQRHKLERLSKTLGLSNTVQFLGERKDAMRILSQFDVFILPSLWEGLPYTLIEAGALGLAVVASNVDGNTEIIKDEETGILVPPKNPDALAVSIIRLLSDEVIRKRLGKNLKEAVLPRYTLSRMTNQTQELYLRLYEKSGATKKADRF
jgi:glycosyltransferase involved in cell wall biosynthesis